MERIAVSNTGPIIALAKVDRLFILSPVLGTVLIPPLVERELFARRVPESARIEAALGSLIERAPAAVPFASSLEATRTLDAGEAQAVQLACARGLPLLIDDSRGRAAAASLRTPVVGTVGVLLDAKRLGVLEAVGPVLRALQRGGYYLSEPLIRHALGLANESEPGMGPEVPGSKRP